ncbi:MAG: nitrate- and nitrite sensing domain-containing protein [Burkholderiales bacterium]
MPDPTPPLSVATLLLHAKQLEIDAARHLAGRAELVDVLGQLIHELQRERGASSAFLASRGQRMGDVREAAVAAARPVQARLGEMFSQLLAPKPQDALSAGPRMVSRMAWALLGLEALDELRAQIAGQALSAHGAVAAYSRLIAGLVELIFHVADAALLPQVSRLLVAFLHLVQGKEAAGQERAVGALLFGAGAGDDAQQQRVLHLIDAQERSLQVFADPALRARWEAMQLAPAVARLERLRRTLVSARPGTALDSKLSNDWFELTSERIGELWQLQGELVQHLREACAAQIGIAQQDLTDAAGLLRSLRDNPPAHAHAVERFFEAGTLPEAAPELTAGAAGAAGSPAGSAASLLELLQVQSARLARMEAELEAARRTLHERKVIERAKGVLMSRLRLTEEAAFRALQKTSMDQNRRLLEVAEATLSLPDFAFGIVGAATPTR